ncbi:MAG: hypothetical protein JXQ69_01395 [Paludibacteraceae bacterium]|nr:hypothetical protein [Paludibacteraceae bacterium]MBN2786953.1 hypothetical protein [Paludibacteraceae bacterium]
MNLKIFYTIGLALSFMALGIDSYAQQSGTISLTTGYIDDMQQVWDINTGTPEKPVLITYTVDTEEECDYVWICSVDNAGNMNIVKILTGSATGTVSTILPTGKAKVLFFSDGSVCYADGYAGFSLNYAVDNTPRTYNENTYTSSNAIIGGKVGIGTIDPREKLDVNGNVIFSGSVGIGTIAETKNKLNLIQNQASMSPVYGILSRTYNHGNGNVYGIFSSVVGPVGKRWAGYFNGGDVTVLGGNIGVGTATPKAKFEIVAEGDPLFNEDNPNNGIQIKGTDQVLYMGVKSDTHVGYIQSVDYGTVVAPLLLNARGGNVGIGTTTPISTLDVNGDIHTPENSSLWIGGYGDEGGPRLRLHHSTNAYIDYVDHLYFRAGVDEVFTMTASGKVGIGTVNPQNALDVNGTIHAKEVKVDLNGWADFVFEKNYNLPSLAEVNQFIEDNGHLPNIPSAQEVKENGVNLAEMQAKLLQKVEELTLYSIQQQKEIQSLKSELESLKNK